MKKLLGLFFSATLIAPAVAEPGPQPEAKPAREKMICKRQTQIGTLGVAKKMCHTKAEWDKMRADGRDMAADLQGKGFTNCEGSDPNGPNC